MVCLHITHINSANSSGAFWNTLEFFLPNSFNLCLAKSKDAELKDMEDQVY